MLHDSQKGDLTAMSNDKPTDEPPSYRDPVEVHAAHLLTAHTIWYNPERPGAGFGLGGIYTHYDLPDGFSFPVRVERVFVYFQLWGDSGEYRVRIRLVKINETPENELEEIQLGPDGVPREFPLPTERPVTISGLNYVEEVACPIGPVPFREAGVYEYQLWVDGIDEPIARERILAREWTNDE